MDYLELSHNADIDCGGVSLRMGDLRCICCGSRNDAPNHRFGPAARKHYWFIYIKDGEGYFEMSGRRHPIRTGTVFVGFPNQRIFYQAKEGTSMSIRWICLAEDNLAKYLDVLRITEEEPTRAVPASFAIEHLFQELFYTVGTETVASKFRCEGLVYRFLSLLGDDSTQIAPTGDHAEKAIRWMEDHYDRTITVADAAEQVGLSTAYFCRLFRQKTGISPGEWLTRYRMEKAGYLLLHTDLKINEVARSVGFEDALYFSRRFAAHYGIPPLRYRKENGAV